MIEAGMGNHGGKAKKDNCGHCDIDLNNDCKQDCAGIWGGKGKLDCAGACNGKATKDCANKCNGKYIKDHCMKCVDPSHACKQDCSGRWGGHAKKDKCGKCNGNGKTCASCDQCGKCDKNPKNDCTQDCKHKWGGKATKDKCGICGGKSTVVCCKQGQKPTNTTKGCVPCSGLEVALRKTGCEICDPGKIPDSKHRKCVKCPDNMIRSKTDTRCRRCPDGSQPHLGVSCKPCEPGHAGRHGVCGLCRIGTESPDKCPKGNPNCRTECKLCGGNLVKAVEGAGKCAPCKPGLVGNKAHTRCVPKPKPKSKKDCKGVANGKAVVDKCRKCVQPKDKCTQGCDKKWGSNLKKDKCGVCGGNGKSCKTAKRDCKGHLFAKGGKGNYDFDNCEKCVLPKDKCKTDCAGDWGGNATKDDCGVCGGDDKKGCGAAGGR